MGLRRMGQRRLKVEMVGGKEVHWSGSYG